MLHAPWFPGPSTINHQRSTAVALSRDSMMELFRRGEVLPEGRTNEEEVRLVKVGAPELPAQASEGAQTAGS